MSPYEIGLLSGGLSIFINYIIGKPSSEFSPYEIFSNYTVWLSKRRLQQLGLYRQYLNDFENSIKNKRPYQIIEAGNDFKRQLYQAAEPFFTWERAVGMCSVCTGFWIALITGIIFFNDYLLYLLPVIVISHVTIRLLNKLI